MKAIDLLNVMSDIDPAFIEEASQGAALEKTAPGTVKKKSGRNKVILMTVLPMAACLFIVVGVVLFSGKSIGNMSDSAASQSATSAATMSESAASDSDVCESAVCDSDVCESAVCESAEPMDSEASSESADMYEEAVTSHSSDDLRGQSAGKNAGASMKEEEQLMIAAQAKAEYEDGILTIKLSDVENKVIETVYTLYKLEGDEWIEITNEYEFDETKPGVTQTEVTESDEGLVIDLSAYNLSEGRYRIEINAIDAEFDVK